MAKETLTHGSLFSGIGGFELAAKWCGWTNVFSVEKDPHCQKVLTKRHPETDKYFDIFTFDTTPYRGTIDVISGGFPCQPFSSAGLRKGKDDERYLWPEMLRVIREIRPAWVVGENVSGLLNQAGGLAFEEICASLENAGYEAWPFVLPASGVGAFHRRNRVWLVAYCHEAWQLQQEGLNGNQPRRAEYAGNALPSHAPDGFTREYATFTNKVEFSSGRYATCWLSSAGWVPIARRLCRVDDGLPPWIHRRNGGRLGQLGNSIVPQVAYQLFKTIAHFERTLNG